jgi:hypothetical protein
VGPAASGGIVEGGLPSLGMLLQPASRLALNSTEKMSNDLFFCMVRVLYWCGGGGGGPGSEAMGAECGTAEICGEGGNLVTRSLLIATGVDAGVMQLESRMAVAQPAIATLSFFMGFILRTHF